MLHANDWLTAPIASKLCRNIHCSYMQFRHIVSFSFHSQRYSIRPYVSMQICLFWYSNSNTDRPMYSYMLTIAIRSGSICAEVHSTILPRQSMSLMLVFLSNIIIRCYCYGYLHFTLYWQSVVFSSSSSSTLPSSPFLYQTVRDANVWWIENWHNMQNKLCEIEQKMKTNFCYLFV